MATRYEFDHTSVKKRHPIPDKYVDHHQPHLGKGKDLFGMHRALSAVNYTFRDADPEHYVCPDVSDPVGDTIMYLPLDDTDLSWEDVFSLTERTVGTRIPGQVCADVIILHRELLWDLYHEKNRFELPEQVLVVDRPLVGP
jgi:hypothetical protein